MSAYMAADRAHVAQEHLRAVLRQRRIHDLAAKRKQRGATGT